MSKYLFVPLVAIALSQVIKFFVEYFQNKKFNFKRLLDGSGGMPSSHSTLVSSLTMTVGLENGFNSIYFAICLIFSLVVLYDSMGVRYEAGKQAEAINKIYKKMNIKYMYSTLKEKVGHRPIEVVCGILLGIAVSLIMTAI